MILRGLVVLGLVGASGAAWAQSEDDELRERHVALWQALAASGADPSEQTRADQALAQSLELYRELVKRSDEFPELLFEVARDLGLLDDPRLDIDDRVAMLGRAGDVAARLGRLNDAAQCSWWSAGVLRGAGRLDAAAARLELALAAVDDELPFRPWLVLAAADVAEARGHGAQAHALLDELERGGTDGPGWEALAVELSGLRGEVFLDAGLPDVAAPFLERALRQAEALVAVEARHEPSLLNARHRVARLDLALNDHEQAVARIAGFLADRRFYAARPSDKAILLYHLGLALAQLEARAPDREPRAEVVLGAVFDHRPHALIAALARLGLARLALDRGDWDVAEQHLSLVETSVDGARIERATLAGRLARDRGDAREQLVARRDEAEAAFAGLLARRDNAAERAGGFGLLRYRAWRGLLHELTCMDLALEGREAGALAALERVVRLQQRSTLARRLGVGPMTLADYRATLTTGQGCLLYLPAYLDGSWVIAFDAERVACGPVAAWQQLEPVRRAYLAHLRSGLARMDPSDRWQWTVGSGPTGRRAGPDRRGQRTARLVAEERHLATALSSQLLPDEVTDLVADWSAFAVVGLDALGHVPFACLPLGSEDQLGVRRAVTLLPSLPVGAYLAGLPRPPGASLELLVVGGVDPPGKLLERWPELTPLPLTDDMLSALGGAYDSAAVLPRATLPALTERLSRGPGPAVLQFLVHGVQAYDFERPACLVLDHGLLTCADVERLKGPELVLLASCRSGVGRERAGDGGSADMAGAWLVAGSSAVLVSHADLTFGAALAVSERMHALVSGEGLSAAESLRRARNALTEDDPALMPFHLGLLDVVGLGAEPLFPSGG